MHSFLLIGQSNMAGRGKIGEVESIDNPDLYVMRNGRWQKMYVPVNGDRPFSGICLAESFADKYSREKKVEVGLIPCADGGTSLEQWKEGGLLYDHAVMMTRLAMRTSSVRGILWHQGEAECSAELCGLYEEKFLKILHGLRRDLNLPNVPFIIGGLGDFLALRSEAHKKYAPIVNDSLCKIGKNEYQTAFVSAKGLSANEDNLHFNAKSLREFGLRYYDAYKSIEPDWDDENIDSSEGMTKTALELL